MSIDSWPDVLLARLRVIEEKIDNGGEVDLTEICDKLDIIIRKLNKIEKNTRKKGKK